MKYKEYKKHPLRFFENNILVTNKDITNINGYTIPKGSVVEVKQKYRGFSIFWNGIYITRVHPNSIDIL